VVTLAEKIALSHHEKWDGSGYPQRLCGDDIPIEARIVSAADVLDALSYPRPYRDAWMRESVLAFLESRSGSHFDPRVIAALFAIPGIRKVDCLAVA
jgi:putative two-component system response regulator